MSNCLGANLKYIPPRPGKRRSYTQHPHRLRACCRRRRPRRFRSAASDLRWSAPDRRCGPPSRRLRRGGMDGRGKAQMDFFICIFREKMNQFWSWGKMIICNDAEIRKWIKYWVEKVKKSPRNAWLDERYFTSDIRSHVRCLAEVNITKPQYSIFVRSRLSGPPNKLFEMREIP